MGKRRFIALIVLASIFITSCSIVKDEKVNPNITKAPSPLDLGRGKLTILPAYDKYQTAQLQVDLRSYDLTSLNLKKKYQDLIHADFDTKTRWPYGLPKNFNPKKIIGYGKNPGLNIRQLHKEGITGKGVNIAIIGGALLVNHEEYEDRLQLYEEIHCLDKTATLDGCAVVSVAAGKNTGVAPGANIYYIANTHGTKTEDGFSNDFSTLAQAVRRVIKINDTLLKENRIRVLLIGCSWAEYDKGYQDMVSAVDEAKKEGIFVISDSIYETYDYEMNFNGLGRDPLSNPDKIASFGPGSKWKSKFFMFEMYPNGIDTLLVPMDSRCTASPTGHSSYAFYNIGGPGMSAAYVAGLYALACQVMPQITPQEFWDKAFKTCETVHVKNSFINYDYKMEKVVNPVKLIKSLMK